VSRLNHRAVNNCQAVLVSADVRLCSCILSVPGACPINGVEPNSRFVAAKIEPLLRACPEAAEGMTPFMKPALGRPFPFGTRSQSLLKIGKNVTGLFDTDGDTHQAFLDA